MKSLWIIRGIHLPILIVLMLFNRSMFCSFQGSGVAFFATGAGIGFAAIYYYVLKPILDTTQKIKETTVQVDALKEQADTIEATQKKHTEKLDNIERTQAEHTKSFGIVRSHCEGIRSDLKTLKELTERGMATLQKGQEGLKKGQRDIKTAISESAQQQGVKIDAVKNDTSDIRRKLNAQNGQGQANGAPAQKSAAPDQYQSLFQTTAESA